MGMGWVSHTRPVAFVNTVIFNNHARMKSPIHTALKLLVVEDNPVFRDALVRLIRNHHPQWLVESAENGKDALALLGTARRFDLVLVDIGLPDMDGIQVIRKAHARLADLPIIVITVVADERKLLNAIRAGARGYLLKSDEGPGILHGIHQVLTGTYPISPKLARSMFNLLGSPAQSSEDDPSGLTPREIESLRYLAQGLTYTEVAKAMGVALSTVQTNVRNIYRKLEASSKVQAVLKAQDAGLI
jgi:two-component system, NarL family, nitrate/nitrite response regulator NarL